MPRRGHGRGHGRGGRGRGWNRPIRGFLVPCLLLILEQGQNHGYDMIAALEPLGMGHVNPSLVYRALRDMEEQHLVESEWDTETSAGPARRVYRLTQQGSQHLEQWVQDLRETDRVLHHFIEQAEQQQSS